jgi:hypothetical protein
MCDRFTTMCDRLALFTKESAVDAVGGAVSETLRGTLSAVLIVASKLSYYTTLAS